MKRSFRAPARPKIVLIAASLLSLAGIANAADRSADAAPFKRSGFGNNWSVLSNEVFFGGPLTLFGLSPATRTSLLSLAPPSKSKTERPGLVQTISEEELLWFALPLSPNFVHSSGRDFAPNAITAVIEWANVGSTWAIGSNWVGNNPPADSTVTDVAAFGSTGSALVNPNLTSQRSVNGINFLSGAFSYTITGSALIIGSSGISNSASNAETFSNNLRTSISQTWSTGGGGALILNGSVDLNTNANSARILSIDGAGNTTFNNTIQNSFAGSTGRVTKNGAGTLTLSGNNTFNGTTTINGGTVALSGGGSNQALGGTSEIIVNSTGTLLHQTTSNQINNSADLTLNGGRYRLSGNVSEGTAAAPGLGSLTLASNSIIDLSGTNLLHFDNSSTVLDPTNIWTGTLSIYNWSGTPVIGGGSEQILFGTNATGLSPAQLGTIQFYSGEGTGAYPLGGLILSTGEVVPVPESSTSIGAALALMAVGFAQLRKRSSKRPSARGLIARRV